MSEYIEKEAVINFIENGLNNPDKTKSFGHDAIEIMAEVRYMPAADVVEVRHGEWIETQEPLGWCDVDCAECSVCHESWIIDEDSSIGEYECMWHYCPNCGAKMDGGNNNA